MLTDQHIPLDGQWKLYYAENKRVHRELDEAALLTEEALCALSYPSVAATTYLSWMENAGFANEFEGF